MRIFSVTVICLLSSWSVTAADKPNFSGAWHLDGESQLPDGILTAINIVQNESNLRMSDASAETNNKNVINCTTTGKQCDAMLEGRPVRVSYWYNGPVLVEMLYLGKDNERVVKTRRSLSDDGHRMTVEMIQIVPPGKSPAKAVFVRDQKVAHENAAQ